MEQVNNEQLREEIQVLKRKCNKKIEVPEGWLSLDQMSDLLGIAVKTARKWIVESLSAKERKLYLATVWCGKIPKRIVREEAVEIVVSKVREKKQETKKSEKFIISDWK